MLEETTKKSYYAIIPAFVRYDEDLTPNAKLLYGEITALCNEKGYCWSKNEYFANLYNVSTTSISKWINSLVKKGYIISEIVKEESEKRVLRIPYGRVEEMLNQPLTKVKPHLEEKLKHNNTNLIVNKENIKENNTVPIVDDDALCRWFAKMWDIYPRKVDKVQAKKTLEHKLRGMTYEEGHKRAISIFRMLEKQIALWEQNETELQFIKHFGAWLNANVEDSPHFKRGKRK